MQRKKSFDVDSKKQISPTFTSSLLIKFLDRGPDNEQDYLMKFLKKNERLFLRKTCRKLYGPIEPMRYSYARNYLDAPTLYNSYNNLKSGFIGVYANCKGMMNTGTFIETPVYLYILFLLLLAVATLSPIMLTTHGLQGGLGFFKGAIRDLTIRKGKPISGIELGLTLDEMEIETRKHK